MNDFSLSWASKVTGKPQLLHCQAAHGGSAVVTVFPRVPEQRRKLVKDSEQTHQGSPGVCWVL